MHSNALAFIKYLTLTSGSCHRSSCDITRDIHRSPGPSTCALLFTHASSLKNKACSCDIIGAFIGPLGLPLVPCCLLMLQAWRIKQLSGTINPPLILSPISPLGSSFWLSVPPPPPSTANKPSGSSPVSTIRKTKRRQCCTRGLSLRRQGGWITTTNYIWTSTVPVTSRRWQPPVRGATWCNTNKRTTVLYLPNYETRRTCSIHSKEGKGTFISFGDRGKHYGLICLIERCLFYLQPSYFEGRNRLKIKQM